MVGGYLIRRLRATQHEVVTTRMPIAQVLKTNLVRPLRELMSGLRFNFHPFQDGGLRRLNESFLVDREDVGLLRMVRRLFFKRTCLLFKLTMNNNGRVTRLALLRRFRDDLRNSRFTRLDRVSTVMIKVTRLQ